MDASWTTTGETGGHFARAGERYGTAVVADRALVLTGDDDHTVVVQGSAAQLVAWTRRLHLNALRAAGDGDLAALVQDLRARTYPPQDGPAGARSARHVVDLHGVTVDVQVLADHTVVDLNTDEVPTGQQPVRINLGDTELTDPYWPPVADPPPVVRPPALEWDRVAARDPFAEEEYPELTGDVEVAGSLTQLAGYPVAAYYVGPDGDGAWTATLVRLRDGRVDPGGCLSLGRFDCVHDAKDAAQAYENAGRRPAGGPRYGYVAFHTPGQPDGDAVAGRWRFRLGSDVADFADAWRAAVHDFQNDRSVLIARDGRGHAFNYGDLIELGQDLLARHGLYIETDPPGVELLVDHDAVLLARP